MIEEVTCGLLFVQRIQHSLIPRPLSRLCLIHVDCVGEPGNKAALMPGLMIDDDVIMHSCYILVRHKLSPLQTMMN